MKSSLQDSQDFYEAGRQLFASAWTFTGSASAVEQLPPPDVGEIAFAGRSNVGKSSLINALTNQKSLARTSNTPGRTQALNFFAANGTAALRLVDMPGYGYAAAAKEKITAWTRLVGDYLRARPNLLRVFVLVDGRHGLRPADFEMFDLLDKSAVSYQIVLTKRDSVKRAEQHERLIETEAALARRPAAFPQVLLTSARDGEGVEALRAAIAKLLAERGV